ncbi:hypothetical protein ON010_g6977 [Phytophthora cinnamomi]|nr:hypothetical protein ON010_g6977 [Phytophthora cinnamomi]
MAVRPQWRRVSPGDNMGHEIAAKGILKCLSKGGRLDEAVVVKTAGNGHLHVVRWLMDPVLRETQPLETLGGEDVFTIHAAAINGHVEVAEYLREQTKALSGKEQRSPAKTMTSAAENGHPEVVRWLYEEFGEDPEIDLFNCGKRRRSVSATAMDAGARNGHLEVLAYLHELQQSLTVMPENARERENLASPQCTEAAMDAAVGTCTGAMGNACGTPRTAQATLAW